MGIEADNRFAQYLIIQVLTLVSGYLAIFIDMGIFTFLPMVIFLMASVTLFRSLGVVLHSNADSLGLKIRFGKQVEEEQTRRAKEQEISELSTQLYKLCNANKVEKAWELLEKRLLDDHFSSEADIFARISKYENPDLAIKAGRGFIERLIANHEIRKSWDVLAFCYTAANDDYILLSAESVIQLSANAETLNQKKMIVTIIQHFEQDFPNHPKTADLLLTAARFRIHDLDDFDGAREIMSHLYSAYPIIRSDNKFKALESILAS